MKRCSSIIGILFSLLVLGLPAAWAQDGLRGALSGAGVKPHVALGSGAQLAAADFDNDNRPDAAILLESGLANGQKCFRIELHVTAGRNHAITFSSAESGLAISAVDVNRDGAPDIVIEREFTHERLQVFLNDGHGDFHKVRSEDYGLPDRSAALFCGWFAQIVPLSYLPPTRGLELPGLRRVATVAPLGARLPNGCEEASRPQLSVQSPSSPRAPPILVL
jgi:hypothetical protein